MVPKTLCRTLSFHSALPKGHLGLCEPADFTNQLLKFYSLNKSVNLEKRGSRPSTGQRNVSLLRRLTPDVIKWFQYTLTAIRAVRFNESLHSCSFLCSLIRIWRAFFPHRQCTRIPYTSSHGGWRKEAAQLFITDCLQAAVQEFPHHVMWWIRL